MANTPPGNYVDTTVDHAWDANGTWYMIAGFIDYGGGTQVWKHVGGTSGTDGSAWVRVLHIPAPQGYYCHGFSYALHVGKIKAMFRSQDKTTIGGADIPGAVRFAPLKA